MNAKESFELLRQLFKAQGVKTLVLPESLWNISSFDLGLRGQLYRNYDYADIARWIRENCLTPWDLLSLRDPFGISYILLRTDNITNQESYYISIGSYIDIRNQPDAADTIRRLHMDPSAEPILTEHYRHLPLQHDMLNLMAPFTGRFSRISNTEFSKRISLPAPKPVNRRQTFRIFKETSLISESRSSTGSKARSAAPSGKAM